jgi:hypothetical protein
MDPKARDELLMVVSGLIGIVFGHIVRRKSMAPEQRATARYSGIGVASMTATPALARAAGDVLGVERDDVRVQASLTFATGALLTFFADDIGRYVPGLPSRDEPGQP